MAGRFSGEKEWKIEEGGEVGLEAGSVLIEVVWLRAGQPV